MTETIAITPAAQLAGEDDSLLHLLDGLVLDHADGFQPLPIS